MSRSEAAASTHRTLGLVVTGGKTDSGEILDSMEFFNPAKGAVVPHTPANLPTPLKGHCQVTVGKFKYGTERHPSAKV